MHDRTLHRTSVKDPVCGMDVKPDSAAGKYEHEGVTYFFCNPGCLEKFRAQPTKYLSGASAPSVPLVSLGTPKPAGDSADYTCPMDPEVRQAGPGSCPKCGMALEPLTVAAPLTKTEYVCPMHPEVVRSQPGSCPICGMALEPRTATVEEEVSPELVDMTRRFWASPAFLLFLWGRPSRLAIAPTTPAPWTLKSAKRGRALVPSAAWRWNR